MKIKTVLAINNLNGLNALKEVKKMERFKIEYIILHPQKKGKCLNEILEETNLESEKTLYWEKGNRKGITETLKREKLDLLLSVNFGYIFKPNFLEVFKETMNLHTSYLPYNRGAHPNVWPIIDGTPAGVTLHTMDAEIDKGKIVYQEKVEVEETDTGKTLYEKLENKAMKVLKKGLDGYYTGKINPFIPEEGGTYHSHADFLDLFEIHLDEMMKTKDLLKRLRALSFSPYKNAYYKVHGIKYNLDIIIDQTII